MLINIYENIHNYSVVNREPFSDVGTECWAYDYIWSCISMGVIHGDQDKKIRPNDYCTYSEFVKIIVTTLGWSVYANEVEGGYPDGYFYVANKLGIYPLNQDMKNSFVTKDDAIIMLYNAMKKPIAIQTRLGRIRYEQSDTIIENRRDISHTRGYAKIIDNNSISIDGKIFQMDVEKVGIKEGMVLCFYQLDKENNVSNIVACYQISDLNLDDECQVSEDLPKKF